MQQRPAVDIIHFQHVAQGSGPFHGIAAGAARRCSDFGADCAGNAGQPIQQMQTRALSLAFRDRAR
jgi:hypothetical protein